MQKHTGKVATQPRILSDRGLNSHLGGVQQGFLSYLHHTDSAFQFRPEQLTDLPRLALRLGMSTDEACSCT